MSEATPHVIIVGGGFAGTNAAHALRHAAVRVTVIDRTNHSLFFPLLYQVATCGLSAGEISVPIRFLLRRQRNAEVVMAEVTGFDLQARAVRMGDRQLQVPDHPEVFVIGDLVVMEKDGQLFSPGLATVAIQQGIYVGDLIARRVAGRREPGPLRYLDRKAPRFRNGELR